MIAFDLEIAKEVEGDDWASQRPFGVSCAAFCYEDGTTYPIYGKDYSPQMSTSEVRWIVMELGTRYRGGELTITWNGLGFDFDVLGEECQDASYLSGCKLLALNHIDIAFQMFCEKGFMCGLNAAAKGLGLAGKIEGMSGAKAPTLWAQGEHKTVIEYVEQDALVTMQVYQEIVKRGELTWITRPGAPAKRPWMPAIQGGRLLTVKECLELPLPDQSWMDDPWTRGKFAGWLK